MSPFEVVVSVLFWVSVSGVAYAYLGYPALVWTLAAAFGRRRESPGEYNEEAAFVSVLIIAHNEEDVIAARVENALALEYGADHLEIIVVSDGSTDRTAYIAGRTGYPRVRVLDSAIQRGKAAVLNEVIPELRGDIVVLSDANTFFEPNALRHFVPWFRDAAVGIVVGRLVLTDPATGRNVDSLYWRYETFLKQMDARLNAVLGANGGVYALRRNLFVPLPDDTLVDDFVLPLLIRLRTGRDIVYDPAIVAHEETSANLRCEFRRRSRIGAGGFQSLKHLWRLLSPTRGWIAFTFASHKVLRWVCPFLLIGASLASALLLDHVVYRLAFSLQAVLYLAAAVGAISPGSGAAVRMLRLTSLFTSMNVALLSGFCQWAVGIRGGTWNRTARGLANRPDTGFTDATIRVVHLVNTLEIGGLELVVASLAERMRRRFQLHVICLEGLGPVASRLAYAGVPVECIGGRETSVVRSVIDLRRRLKALRPDVIHTHNEKAHIRGALATLALSVRSALVHTRHGRSRVTGWAASIANRIALWRSRYIVSVSDDASAILRLEGARPERVRVIRNGVDIDRHDEPSRDRAESRMRAVAVSRLTPVKDLHTMLRAARIVADAQADFQLDIVGDGPSRPELEAFRRVLGLERHVTFHGAAEDVRGFLTTATLFVQSSVSEGISLTLLEAMAAGLPIVATQIGGTPEVVEQGNTGILVAPRDPEALAGAMLTVLNDRGLARSMGRSARRRAETSFSLSRMTNAYEALYEDALARPGVQAAKESHVSN
jgi:glycosyltransferase involved in cell wall biosynthesis/cellulose synthase/poly-beta-1,6-N-acetylglucosamine synthase-like glycosyltransferase